MVATDSLAAGNAHASSAAMHGAMPFGPRIEATPETFLEAVEQARALGTGEIVGALHHPELGPISAPWRLAGDPNHGLAGLIARGRQDVVAALPAIVEQGEIVERVPGRVEIVTPDHTAVVRLDFQADKSSPSLDKRWVLTAFDNDERRSGRGTSPRGRLDRAASPDRPASGTMRPTTLDIKAGVPLMRDDGTVEIVSREALARVAEREKWMGDVIAACKN